MPPLVLMLIDSVFSLALHHDRRAQRRASPGFAASRVRAELSGPEAGEPALGGLHLRLLVSSIPEPEGADAQPAEHVESVALHIDLQEERLLAPAVALAELPLDRSGIARIIGELEAWCYARLPLKKTPETEPETD